MENAFYTYFILNCGLCNFNLFRDAVWLNPLDSGCAIHESVCGWYCNSTVLFLVITDS